MGEVAQAADKATSKTAVLTLNKVSDTPSLREDPLRGLDILRFTQIIGPRLCMASEKSRNSDHPQVERDGTGCDERNQVLWEEVEAGDVCLSV